MSRWWNGSLSGACDAKNNDEQITKNEKQTMRILAFAALLLSGTVAYAQAPGPKPPASAAASARQAPIDMVEVEPITCWWRTSTSAVRTGEPFGLTLTCAVVE